MWSISRLVPLVRTLRRPTAQMLHVWTRPYPGGPFADLTQAGADRAEKALEKMVDG